MRTFATAVGVFTLLPSKARELNRTVAGRIILVFPLVGLLLGLIAVPLAGAAFWLGHRILGAAIAVTVVALCTGALHLDGLADTADGIGSRKPAEQALVIMRKSDVGPMGVAALCLSLLLQVAALSSAGSATSFMVVFVCGVVVSRAICLAATTTGRPPAREGGFGALFTAVTSPMKATAVGLIVSAGVVLACVWATIGTNLFWIEIVVPGLSFEGYLVAVGVLFVLAVAAAYAVGLGAAHWFRKRLGGLTGDTFGAIIELSTTAFWVATSFIWI